MIIDGLIIVEGISDIAFLSSFIEAEFIYTNGFEIPQEEINFACRVSKCKKVIVLTDSDKAGVTIRNRINKLLPNTYNVLLDINKCNKKDKHGVAESTIEEVKNKLKEYESSTSIKYGEIIISDLYNLGLIGPNSKERRDKVCKALSLGKCDSKKLLKRINFLQISLEEIKGVLDNGD